MRVAALRAAVVICQLLARGQRVDCERDDRRAENAARPSSDVGDSFESGGAFSWPRTRAEEWRFAGAAGGASDRVRAAWNGGIASKPSGPGPGPGPGPAPKNERNDTRSRVGPRFADAVRPQSTEEADESGRTFGLRRRMQLFLLLPISFKLGIIMTLLLVLAAMSLKTLVIGFIILLLLLHHTHAHAKLWGAPKAHELSDSHKNIHIHVHTLPEEHHHPYGQTWPEPAAASQPIIYSA